MTKRRLLLLLCLAAAAVTVAVAGSTAAAAPPGSYACTNGPITGTYNGNLVVTADCTFSDTVTINGNLTVAPGVLLNDHAAASLATVTVHGNVLVGPGAVLGLGDYNPFGLHTSSVVDGNLIANQPLSLYLGDITVRGNLVSNGGGGEAALTRSFPIKDDTIGGNLVVQGWQGAWIGLLRDDVRGNVTFSNNSAFVPGVTTQGPDSSEVESNTVGGNLTCLNNTPAVQFGDAGGAPNVVSGNASGQCGFGVILPDPNYDGGGPQPISVRPS